MYTLVRFTLLPCGCGQPGFIRQVHEPRPRVGCYITANMSARYILAGDVDYT